MRTIALTALLLLASCGSSAATRTTARGGAEQTAPSDAAPVDEERARNESAYRFVYLPEQSSLAASHVGHWVAIAGGRVLTADPSRVVPVRTLVEADAVARRAAPEARHRFVFRVGDEGPVEWQMGGAYAHPDVVGVQFLLALQGLDADTWSKSTNALDALVGGKAKPLISVRKTDHRLFVQPEVGPLDVVGESKHDFTVATGFTGTAVLSADAARGLEPWEIPRSVRIGPGEKDVCRRAYARFRWPNSKIDLTTAVAIRPR
jgi:hypothetical protein